MEEERDRGRRGEGSQQKYQMTRSLENRTRGKHNAKIKILKNVKVWW